MGWFPDLIAGIALGAVGLVAWLSSLPPLGRPDRHALWGNLVHDHLAEVIEREWRDG